MNRRVITHLLKNFAQQILWLDLSRAKFSKFSWQMIKVSAYLNSSHLLTSRTYSLNATIYNDLVLLRYRTEVTHFKGTLGNCAFAKLRLKTPYFVFYLPSSEIVYSCLFSASRSILSKATSVKSRSP